MHAPEPSTGRAPTSFNRGPHILGSAALKPRTTTSNRMQRMYITIAQFRPAVYLTIGAHGNAVRINAAETRVPRLNPVKPHIICRRDAIKYLALAAMAENAVQWMRDDGQSTLLMSQIDAALYAQPWRNAFFDEERQQMTLPGADFLTYNEIKPILTFCP